MNKNNAIELTEIIKKNPENHFTTYHGSCTFMYKGINFKVCGLITGCGLLQLSGIAYLSSVNKKELSYESFKKALLDALIKNNDFEKILSQRNDPPYHAGAVIATLGSSYFEYKQLIENIEILGFKKIATFTNKAHGVNTNDLQNIYILEL